MKPSAVGLAIALAGVACDDSRFAGNQNSRPVPPPGRQIIKVMGVQPQNQAERKSAKTNDTIDLIIQGSDKRRLSDSELTTFRPVDLYFVIDSTASMGDDIRTVKSSITTIVSRLKQKGIDLQAGIVGFIDSFAAVDARTFPLSGDIAQFQSFLTRLTPTDNVDFPESSMYAIRKSVELLKSAAGRPNSLRTLLAITDVVGHNGSTADNTEETRDCSVAQAASAIDQLAASFQDGSDFRFFYDVPDPLYADPSKDPGATIDCGGMNAKTQMEALMNSMLTTRPMAQRGGPLLDSSGRLNWPLTESGLVESIVPLLESKSTIPVNGTCVAESAILYEGTAEIYRWRSDSATAILSNSSNEVLVSDVLDKRSAGTQKLTLKVERCCYSDEQLAANSFGSCQSKFTQTIDYEIVSTDP